MGAKCEEEGSGASDGGDEESGGGDGASLRRSPSNLAAQDDHVSYQTRRGDGEVVVYIAVRARKAMSWSDLLAIRQFL